MRSFVVSRGLCPPTWKASVPANRGGDRVYRGGVMTTAEATGIDRPRPTIPVKPSFIAAFTLAQIGAYVSFMPLFQVLLPLKAAAIDGAGKAVLLSHVAIFGPLRYFL